MPNKAQNEHILHITYIEDIIDAVYAMVIDGLTVLCKGKAKWSCGRGGKPQFAKKEDFPWTKFADKGDFPLLYQYYNIN